MPLLTPTSTLPLRGCPVAVLDFESTGIDAWTCEPVQVAVVHVDLGTSDPVVAFRSLIRPPCLIPEEAAAVHGITDERVADAPTMAEVLPGLLAALEGRALAAYNLPYDHAILSRFADVTFGSICAFVVAREVDKFEKGKKLGDIAARRGYSLDAHDAAADAMVTAQILPLLLRDLARGKEKRSRFGRNQTFTEGPWCKPSDLASVAAFWRWTCDAGRRQEAELAEYFARTGKTLDSKPWTDAAGEAA